MEEVEAEKSENLFKANAQGKHAVRSSEVGYWESLYLAWLTTIIGFRTVFSLLNFR